MKYLLLLALLPIHSFASRTDPIREANFWKREGSLQAVVFRGISLLRNSNSDEVSLENVADCRRGEYDGAMFYRCGFRSATIQGKDAEALYNALYKAQIHGEPVTIRGYDYVVSDGASYLICEDRYKGQNPFRFRCDFY